MAEELQFADYKHDPLFKFFGISYARKYLTYVIFSAAIILAILAEWEFIKYQMIGRWTIVTGVTIGIITVTIPVVRYAVVWYEKMKKTPRLSIEVEKDSLKQGEKQILTITTKNRKTNEYISGAIIKCGIFLSEEKKLQLEEGVTNCEGNCSYTFKTDKSWEYGKYNVKVGVVAKCYKNAYNTTKKFKVKTSKSIRLNHLLTAFNTLTHTTREFPHFLTHRK